MSPASGPLAPDEAGRRETSEAAFQRNLGAYHAHLDACAQCRNHPFAHCLTGAALLKAAALTEVFPHAR